MKTRAFDYTREAVTEAFKALGIRRGDVLFSHSNLAYFGRPEGGLSEENFRELFLESLLEQIGPEGTFIVPTFTYSFTKNEVFDPFEVPSLCGLLTEIVRRHPESTRSHDPLFSVAAIGAQSRALTDSVAEECFGKGSFWDRFYHMDGRVVNFNLGVPMTFFHYVERMLGVPYRYDKRFYGQVRIDGKLAQRSAIYYCRDMSNPVTSCDWMGIEALAQQRGLAQEQEVGRGFMTLSRVKELYELISETLASQPFFLTHARHELASPQIMRKLKHYHVPVQRQKGAFDTVAAFRSVPRDVVSDGCEACLEALSQELPLRIHTYPTGTKVQDWIVPERWACEEGYVADKLGRKILAYDADLRSIAAYSKSFEGTVDRQELLQHVFVNKSSPQLMPAPDLYYHLDWGICSAEDRVMSLFVENEYKVVIKSSLSYGRMAIGELVLPGVSDETVLIVSRLGSRRNADDGLCGVAAALQLFKGLSSRRCNRTYRLLIVPQDYAVMAYFEDNHSMNVKGICFLDDLSGAGHSYVLHCSTGKNFLRENILPDSPGTTSVVRDNFILQSSARNAVVTFGVAGVPLVSISNEGMGQGEDVGNWDIVATSRYLMKLVSRWEVA